MMRTPVERSAPAACGRSSFPPSREGENRGALIRPAVLLYTLIIPRSQWAYYRALPSAHRRSIYITDLMEWMPMDTPISRARARKEVLESEIEFHQRHVESHQREVEVRQAEMREVETFLTQYARFSSDSE